MAKKGTTVSGQKNEWHALFPISVDMVTFKADSNGRTHAFYIDNEASQFARTGTTLSIECKEAPRATKYGSIN